VTQDAAAALELARDGLRRGLLDEAAQALQAVSPAAAPADRAAAALLTGNLAYERGRYAEAQAAWTAASGIYAGVQDHAGLSTTQSNLELAAERLARRARLEDRVQNLQVTVLALLLAATTLLVVAARRRRRGQPAGEVKGGLAPR